MLTDEQLTEMERGAYDLKATALKQWPRESLETACADHITALVAEVRRLRGDVQKVLACASHVKMGRTVDEVCDEIIRANDRIVSLQDENERIQGVLTLWDVAIQSGSLTAEERRAVEPLCAALKGDEAPAPAPEWSPHTERAGTGTVDLMPAISVSKEAAAFGTDSNYAKTFSFTIYDDGLVATPPVAEAVCDPAECDAPAIVEGR